MSLSLSRRVSNLIGTANDTLENESSRSCDESAKDEERSAAGSDVMVVFHHVRMETDTSQIPPIQNCLLDMMAPRAADKNMADETERMKCKVQLQPNVAKDMVTLEERENVLITTLEHLQNRYAEIEKEQVAFFVSRAAARARSDAERISDEEARERVETEKRVLKTQIGEKRNMLTNTLQNLNALRIASQKSAENSSIREITLQVIEGEWLMGPAQHRLAKVSLKGVQHTQINDIQRGVPVKHLFQITFFAIQNQLTDGKWNKDYEQVLGPLVDHDRNTTNEDFDFATWCANTNQEFEKDGTAMLTVVVDQLAQKEEVINQVVYKSMNVQLYPLDLKITEDLYNCLLAFVFPGEWRQDEWSDDQHHNLPAIIKEKYVESRKFYRVPVTTCRPSAVGSGTGSLIRDSSWHGRRQLSIATSSRNTSVSARPARVDENRTPHTGVTAVAGQKETRELEELKMRARDNKEFQQVEVGSCHQYEDHELAVSISYKGRNGSFPDIDGLVIKLPVVRFPTDDRPLVCTWKELYENWLSEVRWPIFTQAKNNFFSKVRTFFPNSVEQGHAHAQTRARAHTHKRMHTHMHTRTLCLSRPSSYTHTNTQTDTHTLSLSHTHTHKHTARTPHTHTHTHTCTLTHIHIRAHTRCVCVCTCPCARACARRRAGRVRGNVKPAAGCNP